MPKSATAPTIDQKLEEQVANISTQIAGIESAIAPPQIVEVRDARIQLVVVPKPEVAGWR